MASRDPALCKYGPGCFYFSRGYCRYRHLETSPLPYGYRPPTINNIHNAKLKPKPKPINMQEELGKAIRSGKNKKVYDLLGNIDDEGLNERNMKGTTALHEACASRNNQALELLLDKPGIDVNAKNNLGQTPLNLACDENNVKAVELLLARSDIDVNAKNFDFDVNDKGDDFLDSETPIMQAVSNSNLDILKLLANDIRVDLDVEDWVVGGLEDLVECFFNKDPKVTKECLKIIKEGRMKRVEAKNMEIYMKVRDDLTQDSDKMNFVTNGDRFKLKAAEKELECPVCLEAMEPPKRIWMCPQSHIVCEACKILLKGKPCPTCKSGSINQRAFSVEKIATAIFKK